MIRIGAGVDDVANRARRDLLIAATTVAGRGRRTGVDDHDAIVSDLDADVAAGAGDHEEVGSQLKHFEAAGRGDARLPALRRGTDVQGRPAEREARERDEDPGTQSASDEHGR